MFFVGCDIELVDRFEDKKDDLDFLDLVFTKSEQQHCLMQTQFAQHLAARFCGKEAVIKALSSAGLHKVAFTDIEIINDTNGVPTVSLKNKFHTVIEVQVSLSHCKTHAMAQAIAIKRS